MESSNNKSMSKAGTCEYWLQFLIEMKKNSFKPLPFQKIVVSLQPV